MENEREEQREKAEEFEVWNLETVDNAEWWIEKNEGCEKHLAEWLEYAFLWKNIK